MPPPRPLLVTEKLSKAGPTDLATVVAVLQAQTALLTQIVALLEECNRYQDMIKQRLP